MSDLVIDIAPGSRYVLPESTGVPRWEMLRGDGWSTSHLPVIYRTDYEMEQSPVIDHQESEDTGETYSSLLEVFAKQHRDTVSRFRVYDDAMEELSGFLDEHLPWSRNWVIDDDLVGAAREALGNYAPEDLRPVIRASMATMPFLLGIGNSIEIFNDGFYRVSNIAVSMDVLTSGDLRAGIIRATGTYSRPLSRTITRHFRNLYGVGENATLLKTLRGLPPEYIVEVIEAGLFTQDITSLEMRGIPMDGEDVMIPDWLMNQPYHRRARWMTESVSLVVECVRISEDIQVDATEVAVSSISDVHGIIIDKILADSPIVDDADESASVSTEVSISDRRLTAVTVTDPASLVRIGKMMDICVGSETYQKRLSAGVSSFVMVRDGQRPIMLGEFETETGRTIEIAGKSNMKVPDHDREALVSAASTLLV